MKKYIIQELEALSDTSYCNRTSGSHFSCLIHILRPSMAFPENSNRKLRQQLIFFSNKETGKYRTQTILKMKNSLVLQTYFKGTKYVELGKCQSSSTIYKRLPSSKLSYSFCKRQFRANFGLIRHQGIHQ